MHQNGNSYNWHASGLIQGSISFKTEANKDCFKSNRIMSENDKWRFTAHTVFTIGTTERNARWQKKNGRSDQEGCCLAKPSV